MEAKTKITYTELLNQVLTEPGKINAAYSIFYKYSTFNQILLLSQGCCTPVATYKKWAELGRTVKKCSKAKMILRPNTIKKSDTEETDKDKSKDSTRTFFSFVNCIFDFDDTDGGAFNFETKEMPDFNQDKLLLNLGIEMVKFNELNGNCQGYAMTQQKQIAVNPLAYNPVKTMLHEVAHCLLHGSDSEQSQHGLTLPATVKEYEAESTAYIVGSVLGILTEKAKEYSRGYIQNWAAGIQLGVPFPNRRNF